jgi:hypothetical protein
MDGLGLGQPLLELLGAAKQACGVALHAHRVLEPGQLGALVELDRREHIYMAYGLACAQRLET